MHANMKPNEYSAILGVVSPVSQGVGAIDTGWVDIANWQLLELTVGTGVLGGGATLDVKFQHASSSGGAGAEDVTGKALTQIVKASGDNKQATLTIRPEELKGAALNITNGARWVRGVLTVGVAASMVGAMLKGFSQRNGQIADLDLASVVQLA